MDQRRHTGGGRRGHWHVDGYPSVQPCCRADRSNQALRPRQTLVCCNRIGFTIAARDFSRRRGASDAHIPKWICKERATKAARKRTAALRVALKLACGVVARRSQPHYGGCSLLDASPQANLNATNV